MTRLPVLLVAGLLAAASPAAAQFTMAEPTQASNQNCDHGPLNKEFGAQYWRVFGCEDDKTLIFVAGQGNRATPYVFTYAPDAAGAYVLTGKGAGDPTYVGRARLALEALRPREIAALLAAAKAKGDGG